MDNYFVLNNGVKMPAIVFGTVGLKGKEGIDEEFIDQRISNELAMNYII